MDRLNEHKDINGDCYLISTYLYFTSYFKASLSISGANV